MLEPGSAKNHLRELKKLSFFGLKLENFKQAVFQGLIIRW